MGIIKWIFEITKGKERVVSEIEKNGEQICTIEMGNLRYEIVKKRRSSEGKWKQMILYLKIYEIKFNNFNS